MKGQIKVSFFTVIMMLLAVMMQIPSTFALKETYLGTVYTNDVEVSYKIGFKF